MIETQFGTGFKTKKKKNKTNFWKVDTRRINKPENQLYVMVQGDDFLKMSNFTIQSSSLMNV